MPDQEWVGELTHEKLTTPEAKTVLNEYTSQDEFMAAGLEAKRKVGQPYRLPKSLDKLPDDNVRTQFKSDIAGLIGHDFDVAESEESLKDINFAEGLADARKVNADVVAAFSKFAVENKLPKALVQKLAGFNNGLVTAFMTQQEQARTEAATKVNDSLKVLYGGEKGVAQNTENVKRLFKNHCGLTAEEYEESAQGLVDSGMTQSAVICKALFNLAKDIVSEGTTEGGERTHDPKKQTLAQRQDKYLPNLSGHLWPKK
jgi:hypothetical protein